MKMACSFFKLNFLMKRIILCLVIGFAFHFSAFAQPSFLITDDNPGINDQVILDVSVRDFTDLLSVEYTLRWDPTVISFNAVNNFNLIDLDGADFDTSNAANGFITLMWAKGEDPNACADPNSEGVTINDDEVIFSLDFTAVGVYGDFTQVFIDSDPVPVRVTRKFTPNPLCNNIQVNTNGSKAGNVSIGVRPFTITASNETANSGEVVCVDFSVTGWDDLTLFQTTVGWDPTLLSLNQVIPSEDIENLSQASFNENADPGCLPLSWFYSVPSGEGITVPDGTVMFTACFDVLADCETDAEVSFKENPTSTEVSNVIVLGFDLTTFLNPGTVATNDCAPIGLDLIVDCGGPFELNENFCVPIRAGDNFMDVSDMAFQVKWNAGILQYAGTLPGEPFTPAIDYDASNTQNGVLGVSWESAISIFNQDLNPNDIVFEICFDVVGIAGDSPINIPTTQDTVRISNGLNIGVNPTNCLVDITPPAGVILSIGAGEAPQGDSFCSDITVTNFTDITEFQFSLNWNTANFSYNSITLNPAIASALLIDGAAAFGSIAVDWDGMGTALTLNDGDPIATICYDAVGPALSCDQATLTDVPLESEAISTASNGNNIGVTAQIGDWCILSPNGFILVIPDEVVPVGDTICMEVEVVGFTDILETDFCINFNSSGLDFIEFENNFGIPGLDLANITVNEGVGTVCVDWTDLSGTGVTVPDSTVMMEVCFQAIGNPENCEPVGLNNGANVTTLAGPGSVIPNEGEVCIQNKIIITDVRIFDVDCPGNNNGRIEVEYEGGSNNGNSVVFDWVDLIPQQFGDTIQNLAPGNYTVNYFDANDPTVGGTATFTVGIAPGAPVADAGPDVERLCCPQFNILNGTNSSQGAEYDYSWYFGTERIDPNTGQPTGEFDLGTFVGTNVNFPVPCADVADSTVFVLVVTNLLSGCQDQDEVMLLPAELPSVEAGNPQPFSCDGANTFTATGSTVSGSQVTYSWQVDASLTPNPFILDEPSITVEGMMGQLVVTATNSANSCTSTDTTFVVESGGFPIANIGADTVFVGCAGTITLDGNQDPESDDISYQWEAPNGAIATTETIEVSQVGTYIYTATNTITNCVSTDQVVVESNEDFPVVMIDGGDNEFTCDPATDTLTISATLANVSNFNFTWEASNGGQFASGTSTTLTPQVIAPGEYTITVTNQLNGCETTETVEVGENTEEPSVIPFPLDTARINCTNPTVVLTGAGSSVGNNFVYTWTAPNGDMVADSIIADSLGFYTLEILNLDNGCFASDSVLVDTNFLTPILTVVAPPAISCSADSVILVASVEAIPGTISVEWTGGVDANADQLEATVLNPGTYTILVTLEESGCTATETVEVTVDDTVPVAEAGENLLLTCAINQVILDGTSSSTGDRFIYEWSTNDGLLPSDVDTIESFTSTPAVYFLTVTDTILGCSATDSVLVDINAEFPPVSIGADGVITCDSLEHVFNTSQTTTDNVTYQWVEIVNGVSQPIAGAIGLDQVFDAAGSYALVVTDTTTGCVATDFGEVTDIRTNDPIVVFTSDLENLDCIVSEVSFTASVAPDTVDYTYQWFNAADDTPLPGETDTLLTIDTPGDYYIIATNIENQCAVDPGVAMVTAVDNQQLPIINFTQDTFNITCIADSVGIEATGTSVGSDFDYQWNQLNPSGGVIAPGISTNLNFGASSPGIFELIVTNTATACVSVDTAYIDSNYVAPTPIIDPVTDVFFCQTEEIILNGGNSSAEGTINYEWLSQGSGDIISIGNGQTASINAPGSYQMTISTNDQIQSCQSFTTVQVDGQLEAPDVMIMPVDSFDCFTQEVEIAATINSNENVTTIWTDLEGGPIGTNVDMVMVSDTGFYELLVTTNINIEECTTIDTIEVVVNQEEPILEFAPIDSISCVLDQITVEISNIEAGLIGSTTWDGPVISSDDVSALIDVCGNYSATATITNTIIGDCEASAEFVVACDTIAPEIIQEGISDLTCINESETLDISNSTFDTDATIDWQLELDAFDGQTTAETTEPGDYTVMVTNPNGCSDSVVFSVVPDTTLPTILFEATEDFNCSGDAVELDASASGMASDFISILWTEVNGGAAPTPNNTLVTEAPADGEYQLVLVNATNGCTDSTTVTVNADTEAPIAAADTNMDPDDNNIGCDGDALSVGGAATSTGPEFSYLWTVLSGSGVIAAPTNAQTTVNDEGSYILTVLDESNFCTSSDTIFVTAVVDLPLAELGADTTICEMEYTLTANLPVGTTGTWTSTNGDIIDPSDPNTTVMDLQTGDNVFTWTLTSPGCPDYSTASVVISVPDAPVANNDIVEIDETEEMETIVAISNDLIQNNFSFNITTDPLLGQIDSIDAATGTIYYSIKPGQFGATSIVYKICDEDCETLCDDATIEIDIARRDVVFDVANGITMNNDGVNDALIFDQLLNNPDAFENNELIIFNRWGDIVYQAAPYNNDWTGVNENGEELPEGTYYYILRLSIPRGEIIRGDVTIVK